MISCKQGASNHDQADRSMRTPNKFRKRRAVSRNVKTRNKERKKWDIRASTQAKRRRWKRSIRNLLLSKHTKYTLKRKISREIHVWQFSARTNAARVVPTPTFKNALLKGRQRLMCLQLNEE